MRLSNSKTKRRETNELAVLELNEKLGHGWLFRLAALVIDRFSLFIFMSIFFRRHRFFCSVFFVVCWYQKTFCFLCVQRLSICLRNLFSLWAKFFICERLQKRERKIWRSTCGENPIIGNPPAISLKHFENKYAAGFAVNTPLCGERKRRIILTGGTCKENMGADGLFLLTKGLMGDGFGLVRPPPVIDVSIFSIFGRRTRSSCGVEIRC